MLLCFVTQPSPRSGFLYHLGPMKPLHLLVFVTASSLAISCSHPTRAQYAIDRGWSVFGCAPETTRGVDPEVRVEGLAAYAQTDQRVVLSGTVGQVCATMGCWFEVVGKSGATVRVMNKDHAFFIPRNARGRTVHAIGYATVREESVALLQHLAADAGRPQAEIDAITQPQSSLLFIADAVILPSGGLDAPMPSPTATETAAKPAETPAAPSAAEPTSEAEPK